jgi:hypothetical protein
MGNMCCVNFRFHLRYGILYLERGKGDGESKKNKKESD